MDMMPDSTTPSRVEEAIGALSAFGALDQSQAAALLSLWRHRDALTDEDRAAVLAWFVHPRIPAVPTDAEPDVAVEMSAQHLHARIVRDDGPPVLLIHDGEASVEVGTDVGPRARAAEGLTQVAVVALELAAELRATYRVPGRG